MRTPHAEELPVQREEIHPVRQVFPAPAAGHYAGHISGVGEQTQLHDRLDRLRLELPVCEHMQGIERQAQAVLRLLLLGGKFVVEL